MSRNRTLDRGSLLAMQKGRPASAHFAWQWSLEVVVRVAGVFEAGRVGAHKPHSLGHDDRTDAATVADTAVVGSHWLAGNTLQTDKSFCTAQDGMGGGGAVAVYALGGAGRLV